MLSHFTLGSNNLTRAQQFYTPVMAVLGQSLLESSDEYCYRHYGLSFDSYPHLFVCLPINELPATWSNGFHIAFHAQTTTAVDAFHAAAIANGGSDDGPPGLRTHYNDDYYAAYVRDPDGNKLQAVHYQNGRDPGHTGDVVSHITLGVHEFERDRAFYSDILGEIGYVERPDQSGTHDGSQDTAFGFEDGDLPLVYIQSPFDGRPATWGNGIHTAFHAPSRHAVDRFHALALQHGGVCEGPPGLRPHYSANYYGAYVRDLVGNKLQAVYRGEA